MIPVKGGDIKYGDKVFLTKGKEKNLGVFESMYNGQLNIRVSSDNELYTVPSTQVEKADVESVANYLKGQSKDQLVNQAKALKEELKKHELSLEVRPMKPDEIKEYKKEQAGTAAATNIDSKGNIVTEVKKDVEEERPHDPKIN